MIESKKVEIFTAKCDVCNREYEDNNHDLTKVHFEESDLIEDMGESEWYIGDDNVCYCPDCHHFDDEDNLILTKIK